MFQQISPEVVGDAFYSKLFSSQPKLRSMFPKNMDEQYTKLVDMLSAIVTRLERMEEVTVEIKAMGRRHAGYGVRPAHYKLVGNALLWTLEKGLGNDWNEQVRSAWTDCYNLLADTMIQAAEEQTV